MLYIEVPSTGDRFELKPSTELVLGRSRSTDICIRDASVSKRHAKVVWQGESPMLKDIESTNGLWVGDERRPEVPLTPGAELRVGKVSLRVVTSDVPVPTTPPRSSGSPVAATLMVLAMFGIAAGLYWKQTRTAAPSPASHASPVVAAAPAPSGPVVIPSRPREGVVAPVAANESAAPEATSPTPAPEPPSPAAPAAKTPTAPTPEPAKAPAPKTGPQAGTPAAPSPLAPLVGHDATVTLKSGSTLKGKLISEDPFQIGLEVREDTAVISSSLPLEDVAKVNDVAVKADLAQIFAARKAKLGDAVCERLSLMRWCVAHGLDAERRQLAKEILDQDSRIAEAHLALGQELVGDEWLAAEEIQSRGLVRCHGEWLTPEARKARGLVQVGSEWMTPEEKLAHDGMVKFGDKWVTADEAKQMRRGYLSYLGVWVPAPLAFRLQEENYYETTLRGLRTLSGADREEALKKRIAFHLRKAQEALGRALTQAERDEEEKRFRKIVETTLTLDDKAFETQVRVAAGDLEYRPPQEREDLRRMASTYHSAAAVADAPDLEGLNLLNATELNDHQVWHLERFAEAANAMREKVHTSAIDADKRARTRLTGLLTEVIDGVNRGFDVPRQIEGPAAASDEALIKMTDAFQQDLIDMEPRVAEVLTADQKRAAAT